MEKTIARAPAVWQESIAKTVTFVVTEDCQLRCRYCYLVGKNSRNRMSFDTAKRSIDYLVENPDLFPERSIVWDFIGGEPFLEIDLIDEICEYIKEKLSREKHPWLDSHRFSLTTNGILYGSEKVQDFIRRNRPDLSIGVTIDGTPRKHNMHRIYPSGKGVVRRHRREHPLWLETVPVAATKVTVASDLPSSGRASSICMALASSTSASTSSSRTCGRMATMPSSRMSSWVSPMPLSTGSSSRTTPAPSSPRR